MSEQVGLGAELPEANESEGNPVTATAGMYMRQAREYHGVHVAALAVALKVPVSKIEALEEDRYDEFPDNVFMRALAASVCRTLKIDPVPVLALLPSGAPQAVYSARSLNASFKDPTGRFKSESSLQRPNKSRWVGVAVAVLLVGALAVAFLPHKESGLLASVQGSGTSGASSNATDEPNAPSAEPAAPAPAPESTEVAAPAAPVASAAAVAAIPAASSPAAAVAAAVPAAAASVPAAANAVGAQAAAVTTDGKKYLEIRAREASWVKIVSAVNGVVLQREVTAGETVYATGTGPWNVTVGRPDATEVIVRGQPMPMTGYAGGKVARFEVK